jgi:hypothetical protein
MQIFHGNEQDLKTSFGLSAMSVVWVGILRSKGVDVSEPFLELCRIGGPLEPLLKDRSLLPALDKPEDLAALQQKYDRERQFQLVVIYTGGHKVLALQDEVTAEAGWQSDESDSGKHSVSGKIAGQTPGHAVPATRLDLPLARPEFGLQGFENLFSAQEIARLKLTIATTVKAEEKIEAIRKMALAQVSLSDKGILFLHALGDNNLEVRKEAAYALRHIGVHEEVAETIATLCSSDGQRRTYAIGTLGQLFPGLNELEKGAVLQILLTVLRDKEFALHRAALLEVLVQMVPAIPHNPSLWERILAATIEILVSMLDPLLDKAVDLFHAIMVRAAELTTQFLWVAMRKTEMRRLRGLLLTLLADTRPDAAQQEQLAREIAFNIGFGDDLDPIFMRLMGALGNMGEAAVTALLERFRVSIRITERIQLIQILDHILQTSKLGGTHKDKTLRTYLEAFPTATNPLRLSMLETDLLADPEVAAEIKTEFATELLVEIHQERLDQFFAAVEAALCRMREPAIPALLRAVQKPLHDEQAKRAAHILGEVVLRLGADARSHIAPLYTVCIELLAGTPSYRGEIFRLLGKLAGSKAAYAEIANQISDDLLANLCKTAHPYEVLDGLGWCASGDYADLDHKTDICYLFTTLIDKKMPDRLFRERESGGAKIYELDFKTTAYTDLLPIVMNGLSRLATSLQVPTMIRKRVVEYFLKKWDELVAYRIIWGPKNTTDLAQAMFNVCLHADTPVDEKLELTKALYQKKDLFPVMEFLTNIFHAQAGDDFAQVAEQMSLYLLEIAHHEDYSRAEDREKIVAAIGQMLESPKLAVEPGKSGELREKLLYTLFEALREEVFGVRDLMHSLQTAPILGERLQREIQKRLPPRK